MRRGKILRPSGDWLSPLRTMRFGLRFWISSPRKTMVPEDGRRIPEIVLSVVVLPAPLAPIMVTISPSLTSSEMPLRTSMGP